MLDTLLASSKIVMRLFKKNNFLWEKLSNGLDCSYLHTMVSFFACRKCKEIHVWETVHVYTNTHQKPCLESHTITQENS